MNPTILIILVGFSYVVLFGLISIMKREGLSIRFAIEGVMLTLIFAAVDALLGLEIHPVFFLLFLYIVTMRVRILVDAGNLFARQSRFALAEGLYNLAEKLWPDSTNQSIIQVNLGSALLQQQKLDEATSLLTQVLQSAGSGHLGIKYEAAAHYNLGVAYLRKGNEAKACAEFNATIDSWPHSEFARNAEHAIERLRK